MSKQRATGTRFETLLLEPLREVFPDAERTGSAAQADGDYKNTGNWSIEAKAHREIDLAGFVDQSKKSAERVKKLPVVVVKRRNKSVREAYVVMPLYAWLESLKQ